MSYFPLASDILPNALLFLHPYELVPLQCVSKEWRSIIRNKHLIYTSYSKWIFPISIARLLVDIPNLTLEELVKDALLLHPREVSKRIHAGSELLLNAMKAGCSEEYCLTLIEKDSIMNSMVIVNAFQYGYLEVIASLYKLVQNSIPQFGSANNAKALLEIVNATSSKTLSSLILQSYGRLDNSITGGEVSTFMILASICGNLEVYVKIVILLANTSDVIRDGIVKGLESSNLPILAQTAAMYACDPVTTAGYLIGMYLSPEALKQFILDIGLEVKLPETRTSVTLTNKVSSFFWTGLNEEMLKNNPVYRQVASAFRPDLYLGLPERIGFAGTDENNPYYVKLRNKNKP